MGDFTYLAKPQSSQRSYLASFALLAVKIFASRDDFRGARTLVCRVETRLDACRSLRQSQAST